MLNKNQQFFSEQNSIKNLKVKNQPSIEMLNDTIIDSIQDIKGKNIVKLDLRKVDDSTAEFLIICEGESNTQVRAITDNIRKRLKEELQIMPNHVEGSTSGKWVLLDFFETVVHVFYKETREFYSIETLWNDAIVTEYDVL